MDWVSLRRNSAFKQFTKGAICLTGLHRNEKTNNKRTPQYAQSPVQQQNQSINWRNKKSNNDNNGGNRVEKMDKEWSSLFNGHSNDKRNNRDAEKAIKLHPATPRNKPDDSPKREPNRRYGFKQSIPNATEELDLARSFAMEYERTSNWRDEQKPKSIETSLRNIPLPKQFMELSMLEKQTKANVEAAAAADSGKLKDPSIILQRPTEDSSNEVVVDSSDVLRKLLRISDQSPASPSKESRPFDFLLNKSMPPTPNAPFPNQIPAKLLPKPPSDWTGKEQKPKVPMPNNQQPPFPMHPMPMPMPLPFINANAPNGFPFGQPIPYMPFNPAMPNPNMPMYNMPPHPGMMRPFMHSNVRVGMGPQIAANFNMFPNRMGPQPSAPMHPIKQGPIGPQTLSNNSKHMPGHGAFIPLQAIRKTAKPTKNTTAANKSNAAKPNKQQPPLIEQEIHEKIDLFKRQIKDEIARDDERKPQQSQPPKKSANNGTAKPRNDSGHGQVPRPKRLACKFDLPPA